MMMVVVVVALIVMVMVILLSFAFVEKVLDLAYNVVLSIIVVAAEDLALGKEIAFRLHLNVKVAVVVVLFLAFNAEVFFFARRVDRRRDCHAAARIIRNTSAEKDDLPLLANTACIRSTIRIVISGHWAD